MGGSSHVENDAIVKEQEKQAKDAEIKENKRKADIKAGLRSIQYAFEGKPVTKATTHAFDWKKFNDKTVLPKGYTRVQIDPRTGKALADIPGKPATPGGFHHDPYAGMPGYGGSAGTATLVPGTEAVAAHPATGGVTAVMGPDGKIYKQGAAFNYSTNDPTGAVTGGFGDAFYDKYNDAYVDYYSDDINTQKAAADSEAAYRLARAGQGVSSAANTITAGLNKQQADNIAGVVNQASAATRSLRDKVKAERAAVTSQLYQTEDPTLAANTALADVRNLSLETPDLSPLAQVFNIAAVGGANVLRNFNNNKAYNEFDNSLPQGSGSSRSVGR